MKELTVPAKMDYIERVLLFVNAELESVGCSGKMQAKIDVAVDEIFTNVASYAYPSLDGSVTVRINIEGDPLFAEIQFLDSGTPYNPLEKEDPDITLSAEERNVGGLGVYIVKKSMDSVSYEYKGNQNVLTIKKSLS